MLSKYINKLINHQTLTSQEYYSAAIIGLKNENPIQLAAFLILLQAKGLNADEILAFRQAILENSTTIDLATPFLDIVGTGGDKAGTLNISTASALLVAACGVPVVKHGNRAVSSNYGSADILEQLGYKINLSPDEVIKCLAKDNFAFCFAPNYHKDLKNVAEVRKQLGVPTIFNVLGPLLNPAGLQHIMIGVYSPELVKPVAEALYKLGTKKSLVYHGNSTDELNCIDNIEATLVDEQGLHVFPLRLNELGLAKCSLASIQGKDKYYNAEIIRSTLNGLSTALTDTLLLNAGVGLYLFGKTDSVLTGIKLAKERLTVGNIIKPNHLQAIIERKRRTERAKKSFKNSISSMPFGIVAEIKRASPSKGKIAIISDPAVKALEYVNAGAAAVSVLTDAGFEGTIEDLRKVTAALANSPIPVLCKDFIFMPEQIAEAAQAGADAILLMVSVLGEKTVEMAYLARSFGLETLIEVHAERELEIAVKAKADVIGINQRDLTDFTMHPQIFAKMVAKIPAEFIKIAESGIKTVADVKQVLKLGFNGALIGETLSQMDNSRGFFEELSNEN